MSGLFLDYASAVEASLAPAEIVLLQGEKKILPRSSSIWVENGSVLKVEESSKGVLIQGIKSGYSELRLSKNSYAVHVLDLEQERTQKTLQKVLTHTLSLNLGIDRGALVVRGDLRRWKDWQSLYEACVHENCNYQMRANISDTLWTESEQKINAKLSDHALPAQRLEKMSPPTLHLASNSPSLQGLEKFLAHFGIVVVKDTTALELAPMIKVQITVAEVKRDHLLQYGVQWPSSYSAQILPTPDGFTDTFSATIKALEHNGSGRILANPNIICRSGKDAEFLAGGEFPIKIINFHLEDVVWKKYGILLKVSPHADFSGRMSISLTTEVSSVDASRTVDGIPGLFTNRVQSHFDLARPKTIALSGLIKSEESKAVDGIPGLANIPVIGSLFGSRDFRENKTELVIFVRPEVINPDAPDEMIKEPTYDQAKL